MKQLILVILIALSINVYAQEDKTVTLVVSGQGKTQDEAKQNALRSAIEQAFGAFISSKTEILNDNLVKDEIVSIANGNIQKYNIISSTEIANIGISVLLDATVSLNKLGSFVHNKGFDEISFDGGGFAMNIKMQKLNEDAEFTAIENLLNVSMEILKNAIDYKLELGTPQFLSEEECYLSNIQNNSYKMPIKVVASANNNRVVFEKYFLSTIKSLSMSENSINSYVEINKPIYKFHILDSSGNFYSGCKIIENQVLCLRNIKSLQSLKMFAVAANLLPAIGFNIYTELENISISNNDSTRFKRKRIENSDVNIWKWNVKDFIVDAGFKAETKELRGNNGFFKETSIDLTSNYITNKYFFNSYLHDNNNKYANAFIDALKLDNWQLLCRENIFSEYDLDFYNGHNIYYKSVGINCVKEQFYEINASYSLEDLNKIKKFKVENILNK